MADIIRRSWQFILERLSTSTLSVVLSSFILPVLVFALTCVYAWRNSESPVPLAQIFKTTVAPTAISIAVTVFAILSLLGWGIVVTLKGDYRSLKATISDREQEIGRLTNEIERLRRDGEELRKGATSGLPPYPPVVVPLGYGRQENAGTGLFIANDGYPAYDVFIPAVAIGTTTSQLIFVQKLTRLIDKDGKQFFEAWIETAEGGGCGGGELSKAMIAARIVALNVGIVYKDREFRWYRSNCVLERDVLAGVGIGASFASQELIPAPPMQ
jgi:hypothetical protein